MCICPDMFIIFITEAKRPTISLRELGYMSNKTVYNILKSIKNNAQNKYYSLQLAVTLLTETKIYIVELFIWHQKLKICT